MSNYRIIIQYEGTKYQGWQRQESSGNTIQGKIENILTKMVNEKVAIHGAGRTDAGVHAKAQVASFHLNTTKSNEEIMDYMNQYLPEDIAVVAVDKVADRFHARLNARGKVYCYRVLNSKVPHIFDRRYVYQMEEKIDVETMREAASYFLGSHDFKSFTSTKKGKKSTVRNIESIEIITMGDEIVFRYRGDGFLYHMVRILTGTLLEVGLGKRRPEEMPSILEAKNREMAGALAPAKGLCLEKVLY